jgi:hypothetical protein
MDPSIGRAPKKRDCHGPNINVGTDLVFSLEASHFDSVVRCSALRQDSVSHQRKGETLAAEV